jgi:hypothetical protein
MAGLSLIIWFFITLSRWLCQTLYSASGNVSLILPYFYVGLVWWDIGRKRSFGVIFSVPDGISGSVVWMIWGKSVCLESLYRYLIVVENVALVTMPGNTCQKSLQMEFQSWWSSLDQEKCPFLIEHGKVPASRWLFLMTSSDDSESLTSSHRTHGIPCQKAFVSSQGKLALPLIRLTFANGVRIELGSFRITETSLWLKLQGLIYRVLQNPIRFEKRVYLPQTCWKPA